jgi:hypothetical protein
MDGHPWPARRCAFSTIGCKARPRARPSQLASIGIQGGVLQRLRLPHRIESLWCSPKKTACCDVFARGFVYLLSLDQRRCISGAGNRLPAKEIPKDGARWRRNVCVHAATPRADL